MKIRRYHGYDCESVMGFNNGSYIDDEPIEVKDLNEAFEKCFEALEGRYDTQGDATEDENGYELITGYYDDAGNEITKDEYIQLNETKEYGSYSYVFVNFEECE